MKNPLIAKALNRILRQIDKFKIHRQKLSLPEMSEAERFLADEFMGNPPIFSSRQKWSQLASINFCMGVMPPSAMFGRS
jgi:hypothetical protein